MQDRHDRTARCAIFKVSWIERNVRSAPKRVRCQASEPQNVLTSAKRLCVFGQLSRSVLRIPPHRSVTFDHVIAVNQNGSSTSPAPTNASTELPNVAAVLAVGIDLDL